jgi:ribosome-binding factor A
MDAHRVERMSIALKEELVELVGYELEDPRLEPVRVDDVRVAPDGKHALVLVTVPGAEPEQKAALAALMGASNYLRGELSARLLLYHVPDLRFEVSRDPDEVARIERLFKRAERQRRKFESSLKKSS